MIFNEIRLNHAPFFTDPFFFENSSHPGYVTEKILRAMAAGCIPIYWGAADVGLDFNEDSFINCHRYNNFEEVVERMVEIGNSPGATTNILSQPWLLDAHLEHWSPEKLSIKTVEFILTNLAKMRKKAVNV